MARDNVISKQKIDQASGGDPHAIRETLYQMAKNLELQGRVANTQTKNPPGECVATVSVLGANYIVQIQLPGTKTPASVVQGVQAKQQQTVESNSVAITSLYHQIQAANTPRFDAGANLKLYGGETGSVQTYWTITDLGIGRWYFRTRSSHDGKNWNLWKLANGGKALNGRNESVTVENITNGVSAVLTLPGKEVIAFFSGLTGNGGTFTLPEHLYTSSMAAIACPNGFIDTGHPAHGVLQCDVTIPPSSTVGLVGPASFPPLVTCTYQDGSGHTWPGSASFFGFCYDPLGMNTKMVTAGGIKWAVFTLPGGAQLAVASGTSPHGTVIAFPPGFSAANMRGVASPQTGYSAPNNAHGVYACNVDGGVVAMQFADGVPNYWTGSAQWLIFAYSPGLVISGNFVQIATPGGSQIAIGSGSGADGTTIVLPTGYTFAQAVVFAAPRTFIEATHPMHGIAACSASNGYLNLSYADGSGNTWAGNVGWMAFAWL